MITYSEMMVKKTDTAITVPRRRMNSNRDTASRLPAHSAVAGSLPVTSNQENPGGAACGPRGRTVTSRPSGSR